MRCAFAWGVALLVNAATTAGADTLADVLHANGLSPPATLPDLDRQLANRVVTQEGGETVIVYEAGHPGGSARLVGLRLGPGGAAWTRVPLTSGHRPGFDITRYRGGTSRCASAAARWARRSSQPA